MWVCHFSSQWLVFWWTLESQWHFYRVQASEEFLKSGPSIDTLSSAAEVTELLLGDIQQLVQDRRGNPADRFLVVFLQGHRVSWESFVTETDLKFP